MTNNDYSELVKKISPPSKSYKTITMAFLIGGSICVLGQILVNLYSIIVFDEDMAYSCASVTLVFFASLATGLNVFDNLAKYAGAGTLVPITGFSNAITSPALEFKSEGFILGLGAKMFIIAGPVLCYGISASVIYGIIIYILGLY